jgi:hypothetical protein
MPLIRATSDALVYIGKGYGAAGPQAINPAVEPLPTAEVDPGTHRDCSRRPTTAPVVPPPAPRLSPRSETWGSIVVQEGRDQSRRCFLPHNYSRPERAARSTTRGALVEGAAYRNVSRKVTCTTRRDRASRNAPSPSTGRSTRVPVLEFRGKRSDGSVKNPWSYAGFKLFALLTGTSQRRG